MFKNTTLKKCTSFVKMISYWYSFAGLPPNTGTATLTVSLNDINDNAPCFSGNPLVKVMENTQPPVQMGSVPIVDLDGDPFGAPFSAVTPQHESFRLTFENSKWTNIKHNLFPRTHFSCNSARSNRCKIKSALIISCVRIVQTFSNKILNPDISAWS